MKVYRYYCMKNTPRPEFLPVGFVGRKVWGSRPYVSDVGGVVLGTVDYRIPLPAAVALHFGLLPVACEVQPTILDDDTFACYT